MDMRLKELPIWLGGRRYVLRCNMNVLAELQEQCDGLGSLLESKMGLRSYNRLVAAMVNEAADAAGLDVRYTDKEIGRMLGWKDFQRYKDDVFALFIAAISDEGDEDAEQPAEGSEKNAQTSEAAETD